MIDSISTLHRNRKGRDLINSDSVKVTEYLPYLLSNHDPFRPSHHSGRASASVLCYSFSCASSSALLLQPERSRRGGGETSDQDK